MKYTNNRFPEAILSKPGLIVLTEMDGIRKPCYAKKGKQGLLDVWINDWMGSGISEKMAQMNVHESIEAEFYIPFTQFFMDKKFTVLRTGDPIALKGLEKPKLCDDLHAPYDMMGLKEDYKADYAFVLESQFFGAIRPYYGFIPTGAPTAQANIRLYLIDLRDNSLQGFYQTIIQKTAKGQWDEPPYYPSLMRAVKSSLEHALKDAYAFFFGNLVVLEGGLNPEPKTPVSSGSDDLLTK